MSIWGPIIGAIGMPLAKDILGLGEKDESDKRLVSKPKPPVFKGRTVDRFQFDKQFNTRGGSAVIAGAEPSLKSVNPSRMEANYWAAIFADAKRRTEVE